jgi:predicted transcriptional regulator
VLECLKLAKSHAEKREAIPDGEQNYTSIFACHAVHDNVETFKNFVQTEVELVKEATADKIFDFMLDDEEFIKFVDSFNR